MSKRERAIVGCLVGMAVGDALGLPREGLTPRRSLRLFPDLERFYFLFGHGMFSDDAEHACMTAQALLVSGGEPDRFLQSLSQRLRWWLLGAPFGIGKATLKACIRLWLGFSPRSSGVWSAGNGPASRAMLLGVAVGRQPARLRELVRDATRITHRDPKAEWGALAVAAAASLAAESPGKELWPAHVAEAIKQTLPAEAVELSGLLDRTAQSVERNQTTEDFAAELGLANGVTGFINHTVPVALHAWLRFPDDYRLAVQSILRCGGDADSTAAIVGALSGARLGKEGIPSAWRQGLSEWPRDLRWMERLGVQLAGSIDDGQPRRSVPLSFFGIVARNLLFDMTVLAHALRRLLPPY